jgi:hypothetical protein
VLSVASDERLKDIVPGGFTKGLDALKGIQPITYTWNAASGLPMGIPMTGFSAQNVQVHIPEAVSVGTDPQHLLGLQDRAIMATIVNAVKELLSKIIGHDAELAALKSRVAALEAAQAVSGSAIVAPAPADTTAPVVVLGGDAEQIVSVGTLWTDLGATATDTSGLIGSVTVSVNGSQSVDAGLANINTAVPGFYTLVYSARDAAGNVGTQSRTVTVE